MKKFVLWALGIVLALATALFVWAQVSPMPSVFAIRYIFSQGDNAAMTALERHVPPGVAGQLDLPYGDGADEVFDIFYPEGTDEPLPTIVWVHGGAWIAGSKDGVANYLRILASHGYTAVGIDYTIAPRATYPTQTRQVMAALGYLADNAAALNIDPQQFMIAGDSAGAQLAAQTAAIITSPDYAALVGIAPTLAPEQMSAALLFSGAYSVDGIDLDGDFGWFLRTVLWAYTGVRDFMNDPEVKTASVVNYVTGEYPPTFITSGNADPLNPQSIHMAERLSSQGVPVDALFYPEDHEPPLPHEYQFNIDIPDGQNTLQQVLDFMARISTSNHQSN